MYEAHFGLRENPFSSSPSPEFIYQSGEHREALAHFQYAITNREPFVLLTGEVGTGKTTAIQALRRLLPSGAPVALVAHTTLEPRELIEEIAMRFGLDPQPGESKPALMHRLEAYLEDRVRTGGQALLVFDEAHLMSVALLEEIRLLSNLESPRGGKLLQICLVGQPELERHLQTPELRQLRQRISVRYALRPLNREDTGAYIHHRLRAAGCPQPEAVFPAEAVAAVHGLSQGIPREINVLAGQALLNAFLDDARSVARAHVYSAKSDYGFQGIVTGAAALSPETPAPPVPRRVPAAEDPPPAPRRMPPAQESFEPAPPPPSRRPIPVPPESLRPPARERRPASAAPAPPLRTGPRAIAARGAPARMRLSGGGIALSTRGSRGGRRPILWVIGVALVAIVAVGAATLMRDRAPVTDDLILESTAPRGSNEGMLRNPDAGVVPERDASRVGGPATRDATPGGEPATQGGNPAGSAQANPGVDPPASPQAAIPEPARADTTVLPPATTRTVTDPSPPAGEGSGLLAIQVASFRTRHRAEEVLAQVTARTHLRGAVLATDVGGVIWQRILLGAFHTEAEANDAAQPLLRDRTISTVVVRPIPTAWVDDLTGAPQP